MRQLILLNLLGNLLLSTPGETMNYRGGHYFDEYGGTAHSRHKSAMHLEAGSMAAYSNEEPWRSSSVTYYPSPADFYFSDPSSGLASHVKLIYSGDVKLKDFIRLAPLWERGVVLGLPSLLAMILFSHFIF